ncbi:MAG: BsuPI-related putative proteinase inhibitor [Actinomycetota bacterium]
MGFPKSGLTFLRERIYPRKTLLILLVWSLFVLVVLLLLRMMGTYSRREDSFKYKKSIKAHGIQFTIALPKKEYKVGEKISIHFIVKNVRESAETFVFMSEQEFDIIIESLEKKEIWKWSADEFFTKVLSKKTLKPDEEELYHATWLQKDYDGQQVPTGDYIIMAKLTAVGYEKVSVQTTIRITP